MMMSGERTPEAQPSVRLFRNGEWSDPPSGVSLPELVVDPGSKVWIDLNADIGSCTRLLAELVDDPRSREPLEGIVPELATKGNNYPPTYPPKAKAFRRSIFARAYWLAATDSPDTIVAEEVHLIFGSTFAITLRYPARTWAMLEDRGRAPLIPRSQGLGRTSIEADMSALEQRFDQGHRVAVDGLDTFGLVVAIAVLDSIVDSALDSLDTIRSVADRLEANLVGVGLDPSKKVSDEIPKETLQLRRLLRQVRWAFLPADEIDELCWGGPSRVWTITGSMPSSKTCHAKLRGRSKVPETSSNRSSRSWILATP
jgi:hypothetical protein